MVYLVGLIIFWIFFPLGVFLLSLFGLSLLEASIAALLFTFVASYFGPWKLPKLELRIDWLGLLSVGVVAVALSYFSWGQYFSADQGLRFFAANNAHDALWHAALQTQIQKSIPPENPIFAGETVQGYHYIADVLFAVVGELFGLHPLTMVTKVNPVFVATVYALSTYLLAGALSDKPFMRALMALVLGTAASQPWLLSWLFPQSIVHPSMYWLEQPATYAVNPQLMLSMAAVHVLLYGLLTKRKWYWLEVGLVVALMGIKVYAVLVVIPTLVIYRIVVESSIRTKVLYVTSMAIGLLVVVFLLGLSTGSVPFIFSPGWFVQQMFTAGDRLAYETWELARQHYMHVGAWHRLVLHWLYGVCVFLVGNFGLMMLSLLTLLNRSMWRQYWHILGMVVIAIGFPLLFLQTGLVWNTIQILAYARVFVIILGILWLRRYATYVQYSVLVVLIVLSIPTYLMTYRAVLDESQHVMIAPGLLTDIDAIPETQKHIVPVAGIVADTALWPAYGGQPLFVVDRGTLAILPHDMDSRVSSVVQSAITCNGAYTFVRSSATGLEHVSCEDALVIFEASWLE